ncbi:NAD kinase [Polynucleobacter asymbioticus]|uniref:NAD kinase n=2 Tax=Polynucleobacter asymbioticus TaxID=576611 RepID=A4SZS2_POLAQ|nr:NAD kinase [Polynucleobacter asymbioticus]ABP34986.1 NAD(+) kinase [Polynucleobacter asymbioticus QLW-P1DMWA-1]APB99618.1 NAD(+) kinase [Polynucleobacter asymbioticus]APC01924.1 NAD(+) kinase [Polynucleobacter asymbioticus]APC07172.1 NAD(+) kinase [Polynucleobacter asymbioticus]
MLSPSSNSTKKAFSRVALVGKFQADGIVEHLQDLAKLVSGLGCEVFIEAATASHFKLANYPTKTADDFAGTIDLVVVLGGDGTMLGIGRQLAGSNVPLVGINMGRLGYMTDIPIQSVQSILPKIIAGEYEADTRTLLDAVVMRDGKEINRALALNDVVVNRSGISGMVELAVHVNGSFMYNQRSDGLIVSTPTGSTAYALSAGGPILHPHVAGILLVPIAPHSLSNRPIVLPQDSVTVIEVVNGLEVIVNFDMQSQTELQAGDKIEVRQSDKTIALLHPNNHSDYKTLREKLHWNEYPSTF